MTENALSSEQCLTDTTSRSIDLDRERTEKMVESRECTFPECETDMYADRGQRNLEASSNMTKKELVERVEANMGPAQI